MQTEVSCDTAPSAGIRGTVVLPKEYIDTIGREAFKFSRLLLALTPNVAKAETINSSTQMTTKIDGTEFTYQFHGNSKKKVDIVKVSNVGVKLVFPAKT